MTPYLVNFDTDARRRFLKFDRSIQLRIQKKANQLERDELHSRHLQHGLPFFVEEVAGYRIVFTKVWGTKEKTFWFLGDHQEYEKWFRSVEP